MAKLLSVDFSKIRSGGLPIGSSRANGSATRFAATREARPRRTRLRQHALRLLLLAVYATTRSYLPYLALRLLNLFGGKPVKSFFLCYAGSRKYAHYYSYGWAQDFVKWHPSPMGLFYQDGKWGLMLGTPMTEHEFQAEENRGNLEILLKRLQRAARVAGVERITFSGVLPGFLARAGFGCVDRSSMDRTARVVLDATARVRQSHFGDRASHLVVIGGGGRIGTVVQQHLRRIGSHFSVVDPAVRVHRISRPANGQPLFVLDVSRPGVLALHADALRPGDVLLNEVFPEPNKGLLARLEASGIAAYHICGVEGRVIPELPYGYRNALPCCAMHSDAGAPVIRKLA